MSSPPPSSSAVARPRAAASLPGASRERRAYAALALATLLWAGNFVVGRVLRTEIDPALLTSLRWALALLLFLPWAAPRAWRCRAALRAHWRWLATLGATGLAGFHTLVYLALQTTTVMQATLMLCAAPVLILAGAAWLVRAWPGQRQWLGTALSLTGAVVLVSRGEPSALLALQLVPGDGWMALAVLLWAIYSLLLRRPPAALPGDVVLAGSIVAALVLLVPLTAVSVLVGTGPALVPSVRLGLGLLYVALGASLLPFLLWGWGVRVLGPQRAGPCLHLLPLFGAALAVVALDERPVPAQAVGAAAVLGGLWLTARRTAAADGRHSRP